jgi:hypothetical protein
MENNWSIQLALAEDGANRNTFVNPHVSIEHSTPAGVGFIIFIHIYKHSTPNGVLNMFDRVSH